MGHKKQAKILGYALLSSFSVLTIIIMVFIAHLYFFHKGNILIHFNTVGDLHIDDEVSIQGTRLGKISDVDITSDGNAVVEVELDMPLVIRVGYHVYVGDKGVFGDRVIFFENGPQSAHVVPHVDTLSGIFYPGVPKLLGSTYKIKVGIAQIRSDLHSLFENPNGKGTFFTKYNHFVNLSKKLETQLSSFTINLDSFTKEYMKSLVSLSTKSRKITTDLAISTKPSIKKIDNLIEECNSIIIDLDKLKMDYQRTLVKVDNFEDKNIENDIIEILSNLQKGFKNVYSEAHKLKLIIMKDRD